MPKLILEAQAGAEPLTEAINRAIAERIRELDATLRLLRHSLREYELKYNMSSERFYRKYLDGDTLPDTNEFQLWAGEYELCQELGRERALLNGVKICTSTTTSED